MFKGDKVNKYLASEQCGITYYDKPKPGTIRCLCEFSATYGQRKRVIYFETVEDCQTMMAFWSDATITWRLLETETRPGCNSARKSCNNSLRYTSFDV